MSEWSQSASQSACCKCCSLRQPPPSPFPPSPRSFAILASYRQLLHLSAGSPFAELARPLPELGTC